MDATTASYISSGSIDIPSHVLKWDPHIRRAKSSDILVQYDPAIPLKDIYILSNDPSPVVAKRCDFCTHRRKRCTREVLGCARCKHYGETCRFSESGWTYLGKSSLKSPARSKSQPNGVGSARKEPRLRQQGSATASHRVADRHARLRQSLQKEAIQDASLGGCKTSLKKRKLRSSGPVHSDASSVSIPLAQVCRSNGAEAGPSQLSTKIKAKRPRKAPRSDPPAWQVPKVSRPPALRTRVRKAIETHPRIWTGTRAELFSVIPSLANPGSDVIFEGVDAATIVFPGQDDSDTALGKWDDDTWNGRELIFSIVREAMITCPIAEHAELNADDGSRTSTTPTPNRLDELSAAMSIERPSSPEVSLFDVDPPRPVGLQGESIGSPTMDNLKLNFAYDQPMPDFLSQELCEGNEVALQSPEADAALESAIRAFLDDTSLLSAMASVIGDVSAAIPMTLEPHAVGDSTKSMRADGSVSDPTLRADPSASTSVLLHSMSPSPGPAAPSLAGSSETRDVGEPPALLDDSLSSVPMDVSPSPLAPHHPRSPSRATSVVSPASAVDSALPPYPGEVARLIECLSQGELLSVILSQGSPLVPWQLSEEIGYLWAGLFRLTSIKESTQTLPSTTDLPSKEYTSRPSVVRKSWKVHMQWVPGGEALLHDDMDEGYLKWLQSTSLPWWETSTQDSNDSTMVDVCADPFASSLLPLDLIAPFSATSSSGDSFPLGWYCSKCGRVNVQRHLRHRLCESRACIAEARDVPQRGWAADVTSVRNPCRIAVCVAPDDFHADGIVTQRRVDSADGKSVYQYHIPSMRDPARDERCMSSAAAKGDQSSPLRAVDVWHLFTSNLPHAQTEPTELFTKIQREVLLERHPGATLFSALPLLPDEPLELQEADGASCVLQTRRFMERAACENLSLETPLKIRKLEIQACVAETKSRGMLHCKTAHTMLLCLGADVVLSVARMDLKKPTPALTKSKKRDPNEVLSVTLLHGDMAILHGDDIEYTILRTGMSIVVVGECPA